MKESSLGLAPGVRSGKQALHVNSRAARWISVAALLGATCWLIAIVVRAHVQAGWHATDRLEWSVTVLAAVAFVVRGLFLGRPVTARHAAVAAIVLFAGIAARVLTFDLLGGALIAGSGLALMWPIAARRQPGDLSRVWALINATTRRPAGAVRYAGRQVLPVQRGRPGGTLVPDADGLRGCQRGPRWRRGAVPSTDRRFRRSLPRPWLANRGAGVQRTPPSVVERSESVRHIVAADTDWPGCRHRRGRFHDGRAQVPQPASGGSAHPQFRDHHRDRRGAGPRRPAGG